MQASIQYVGEHLWPGYIGHLLALMSFSSGLLAAIAYFFATNRETLPDGASWRRIGRLSFLTHGAATIGLMTTVFYIMISRLYEYNYAQHVSDDLPFQYIFSAFWEGQEGSFMIWMFWHFVLGCFIMWRGGRWEMPVLSTLALIQVVLASMLLGIYIGFGDDPSKFGSSPTALLRQVMDIPLFSDPNYVTKISGQGLNPLLQNYWMTIHPPTLFLGFASVSIPFCFAIAGLWRREHREWLTPALRWALFSGAILGLGVLMGGAWAYEALSFGGYWAWDPVENMSLVPWLIMVAGIHTNLIANATGHSIKSTYLFYLLSFLLIVYSTFLTRSGILGDTSVHAFTEMGLELQLVLFMLLFTAFSGIHFIRSRRSIPEPEKEESIGSREFWMFIGTLVLLFSSVLISFTTSIPVYNKLFDAVGGLFNVNLTSWHRTSPIEPVEHYNRYQLWIAIFVALISAVAQLLRYREANWKIHNRTFSKHIAIISVISLVFTGLLCLWINAVAWQYKLMIFSGVFAIVANIDYFVYFVRAKGAFVGSSLSHIGFGIMLLGILASGLNKQFISNNEFAQIGLISDFSDEDYRKNILLMRDDPMPMKGYIATYTGDTVVGRNRTFTINFKKVDSLGKPTGASFDLYPNVLYDKTFTKIAATNPSTQRYLHEDIFTHISSLSKAEIDREFAKKIEDSLNYVTYNMKLNQPIGNENFSATITGINHNPNNKNYRPEPNDISVGLQMAIRKTGDTTTYYAEPIVVIRENNVFYFPAMVNALGLKIHGNDQTLAAAITPEAQLPYKAYAFKIGQSVQIGNQKVSFRKFDSEIKHPSYQKKEGDVAISALLDITNADGSVAVAKPIYVIRGNQPFEIKAEVNNLHLRIAAIDPKTETISVMIAHGPDPASVVYPMLIAEKAPRSDYIVLQTILFPGINLFWVGSLAMLLGLGISSFRRWRIGQKVSM